MKSLEWFVAARALHVVGVVLWIGGVAFVTTILIPALRKMPDTEKRFELFEKLERRFATQARVVTAITGLSGFYMVWVMNAWSRLLDHAYWWMHLMICVWFIFTLVLFVLEPAFLHRWFSKVAARDPETAFRWLQRMHIILLTLSLITIAGAAAGSHGFLFFR